MNLELKIFKKVLMKGFLFLVNEEGSESGSSGVPFGRGNSRQSSLSSHLPTAVNHRLHSSIHSHPAGPDTDIPPTIREIASSSPEPKKPAARAKKSSLLKGLGSMFRYGK